MKKRKLLPLFLTLAMAVASLAGCQGSQAAKNTAAQETTAAPSGEGETAAPSQAEETAASLEEASKTPTGEAIRIGSLKGPTSMGLTPLMNDKVTASGNYEFTMVTAADELLGKMVNKDLDIALVPANVASVLYNKTEKGVSVIDINTLGVLDIVASGESIQSVADLKGKTVYLTGKGTTPEYVINYLLKENGLSAEDVTLEYKSEATEVAAVLKEKEDAIGLLPQPFVTAACTQNENLKIVLDLTQEWDKVQGENKSRLITGVTIVRNDFLAEHPEEVAGFLADHKMSAEYANANVEETAALIEKEKIVEKAAIAQKALPYCNITYIDGQDMKSALQGYLEVLFDQDAKSVGGALPADDFYYIAQ